jgi:N-formylglutamate amidohydrolase
VSDPDRPDICPGSDPFHTSGVMLSRAVGLFGKAFENVKVNSPFSGAIVPLPFYNKDQRVSSLMIEINRRLLMDENTGEKLPRIDMVFQKTGEILEKVIDHWACSI